MVRRLVLPALALLLPVPALAAELGDPVPEALAVHLTPSGLDTLGETVAALVPERIPVTDVAGAWSCSDDGEPLAYDLSDLDAEILVDEVRLTPADGTLDLAVYATLTSTPATLTLTGDCAVLTDLDETCDVALPTTALELHLALDVALVDGAFVITAGEPELLPSPIGNPLEDCLLADAVGTALGQDPELVTDLILDLVTPTLEGVGDDLTTALDGIVEQLAVQTQVPVGGAAIDLELSPARVDVTDQGLILGLSAVVDLDQPDDCVPWRDGLELSGAGWPAFEGTAPGTSLQHDAAILVSRDFLDMTLFAVWASGALCLDVDELAGAGLTTGLLATVAGDEVTELFPESRPARLQTDPYLPPLSRFEEDGAPVRVDAVLALDAIAELDHRQARLFRSDLDVELGLDVALTTEALTLDLGIPPGGLRATDAGSDLIGPGWSQGIGELAGELVSGLIPSGVLPTVTLPNLLGLRVDGVVWLPSQEGAWQGAYVVLDTSGVQAVEVPGCGGGDLGCGDEGGGTEVDVGELLGCEADDAAGCQAGSEAGCAVVPLPGPRLWPWLVGAVLVWRRRRQR